MSAASGAVVVLWWITLILTLVLIVPVTVRLLHRTWAAARAIHRYAADTRAAAEGIGAHVAGTAAIEEAVAAAGPLLQRAAALQEAGGAAKRDPGDASS